MVPVDWAKRRGFRIVDISKQRMEGVGGWGIYRKQHSFALPAVDDF